MMMTQNRSLRDQEVQELEAELAASDDPWLRLMVYFGLYAGLRVGEIPLLMGVDVTDDCGRASGTILVRGRGRGRARVVPMHPKIRAELYLLYGAHGPRRVGRLFFHSQG